MALSGSKDYSLTRADIIEAALRKIGVYDQGEAIPGEETGAASVALNLMVKEWAARGADLFLRNEVTLFLQPNTQLYTVGLTGTAEATVSFNETTLSGAEASGQTVLSVTSSAGMTAADRVGIKLDDNSIHWTTIATVDSGVQITVDDSLTGDAASGNKVYAYTTKTFRPQKLEYAYRRDTSSNDTKVDIIGEQEYRRLSNKGADGPPTQVWYNPKLSNGELHVWPTNGGKTTDKLIVVTEGLPDDMDAASNNPQFPIEWGNALVWGLAAELSVEYGLPRLEVGTLFQIAERKLEQMLDYDVENANVIFTMGR